MIYGHAQEAIESLTAVNREFVAAIRELVNPTYPSQMRRVEARLNAAIAHIEAIEARLTSGRAPADMVSTDAESDHCERIFTSEVEG